MDRLDSLQKVASNDHVEISVPKSTESQPSVTVDDTEYIHIHKFTHPHTQSEGINNLSYTNDKSFISTEDEDAEMSSPQSLHQFLIHTTTGNILTVLWGWFFIQFAIAPIFSINPSSAQWMELFALDPSNPFTIGLFTYMIGHGSFTHIFVNSIAFGSFGWLLEKDFQPKEYIAFFVVAGILAGLSQVGIVTLVEGATVNALIGASGSISAVIGYVAIQNPQKKMLLFFLIPIKLWLGITLFIFISAGAVIVWGPGAGGIGHTSHIAGILVGLAVGLIKINRQQI